MCFPPNIIFLPYNTNALKSNLLPSIFPSIHPFSLFILSVFLPVGVSHSGKCSRIVSSGLPFSSSYISSFPSFLSSFLLSFLPGMTSTRITSLIPKLTFFYMMSLSSSQPFTYNCYLQSLKLASSYLYAG